MELWPIVIPACIVCAVAISIVRRERRPKDVDVMIDLRDVERVTRDELQSFQTSPVPGGVDDAVVVPAGSLGARLRATVPRRDEPVGSTRPIRINRRRRERPLVAGRAS